MRIDNKITDDAVVVRNDNECALYIRRPGRKNLYNTQNLVKFIGNKLVIDKKVAESFGLTVTCS